MTGGILLCLILAFAGCGQIDMEDNAPVELLPATDIESEPEPEPEPVPEPEKDGEDETYEVSYPEVYEVFDFAEIPEIESLRGQFSINRLIQKYGAPDEVYAHYLPYYSAGLAFFVFIKEDIEISSSWIWVENLSFGEELLAGPKEELGKEKKYYDLTDTDKNFDFAVRYIKYFDNSVTFPRNIEIGVSTKKNVLDAYPPGTAYLYKSRGDDYYFNQIVYYYDFPDENPEMTYGSGRDVRYNFDEEDMLVSVDVCLILSD